MSRRWAASRRSRVRRSVGWRVVGATLRVERVELPGDGLQTNLVLQVDEACEGRTVTTTCDINSDQTATVPSGKIMSAR